MAQLGDAIARYHQLFDRAGYRDLAWAEILQKRLRDQRLADSGSLLAPVLRPQFLSRRQLELLSSAAAQISLLADQTVQLALNSPALLNRLKLLPAEKMLAAANPGYSRVHALSRMDALVENGSLSVCGMDACTPADAASSDQVAELFLQLPIVKDFKRGKYKVSKLGSLARLHAAILQIWKEFGGRDKSNIAILDCNGTNPSWDQSQALEARMRETAPSVRLLTPDDLTYKDRKLHCGDFPIDLVLRCVSLRDLLIRYGLTHPLFEAYRDGAVCVINNFRSEIARRRALFELLTDESCTARFDAATRKLIRSFVPWTRIVSQRKTTPPRGTEPVDLPDFILANREKLVLRPNEDTPGRPVFAGPAMTQSSWERALRLALQTPYVVQETAARPREPFPIFQYGELQMREVEVSVHPTLVNGQLQGASATLQVSSSSGSNLVGIAPVLLLENIES